MARALNKLTDATCKAASIAGRLGDGGGLYLHVKPSGSKSWAFIWKQEGNRFEMGLGAYPTVKLAKARELATSHRQAISEGRNPIAEKQKTEIPSFLDCADTFLKSMEGQWRNEKHRAQWRMTVTEYTKAMHHKSVAEIGTDDVLKVLSPMWQEKPETASRLRGRLERILDFAKVRGWRTGENPALWRGHLKSILPARQKLTRGHHAAMPYSAVPAFMRELSSREAMAARGLEFLILTAARSGEVLGATWSEIDLDNAIWTVPANRMKAGKEHRVPLTPRALAIAKALHETRFSDWVFPGQRLNRPLSGMSFDKLMERVGVDQYTVHGFRSAFRDWVGDETHFPREVAEQALAHRVGDATERAYRRADALEKRRKLMEAWETFIGGLRPGNVVRLASN
nr:integrase arm-type DNA-binding domain-containing protein [uncultured Gellertiella sp.]